MLLKGRDEKGCKMDVDSIDRPPGRRPVRKRQVDQFEEGRLKKAGRPV